MAYETFLRFAVNQRIRIIFLRQLVEDRTRLGIDFRNFNELAVIHPTHIDVIVEINSARGFRPDLRELKARFGKDQSLGGNGDVQLLQQRAEITVCLVII